ncbi:cation/H(+) antiporter 20-like [Cucurbita maxima]|uniref:Cation/H(+) antiporter 20-like n=1 Tax=Cucurbita maxima TaxID=3661 RepID=A0A6J1I6S2_CUCMA|nr:cation/H(+) antiporter 20-like [Cucurbita maxima]
MKVNITSIKTASNGVWQGDNPLNFAFPLLILQSVLILLLTRLLAAILKPLRQPKVIAEILGGILLGPSVFGRNQAYLNWVFPDWSTQILETVASIGLLFFLFLVGLELDLSSVRRSGRRAFGIAVAGIAVPFLSGTGVAFVLRKTVDGADNVGYWQFVVFIGVALSITAFPVLTRILAELKLLTTEVGEIAMAAAAFNDMAAWILLALAIALTGNDNSVTVQRSSLVSVWVLLSGAGFVVFMMTVVRPGMKWVGQRCSYEDDAVEEGYVCLTLIGVLVCGFVTDLIGIHSIFGGFVFGLTVAKEGRFAERLIERIEDFVSGLLLPLYFASSGLKTNVTKINGGKSWGLLALVISTACAGKILATFAAAMAFFMPAREAMALGLLMNTKGLVELIVLNIGKEKKVLNEEVFAILVLMALFTTFITTPTVMAIYKPARAAAATQTHRKLRHLSAAGNSTKDRSLTILACLHSLGNVPALISLTESTRSTKTSSLKLFVMHLVELTERSSSILMAQRARKNGFPFFARFRKASEWHDQMAAAFQAYIQLGRVKVRPTTAVSSLTTMHEDICGVADDKRVAMIILPFHRNWRTVSGVEENMGHGWRVVNQRVLKSAPCSVAVLVDRGLGAVVGAAQRICVMFFGGPDDREALELGGRMAEHPAVKVTVVRFRASPPSDGVEGSKVISRHMYSKSSDSHYSFSTAPINWEKEKVLDEAAIAEFRAKWDATAEYTEKEATDTNTIVEGVVGIGKEGGFDLIVVGKGRVPSRMVAKLADRAAEHSELGPVGDILSSSGRGIVSSILVIQQHEEEETPALNKQSFSIRGASINV